MSRHFNYEIDERRVKDLLQGNSMSFSEDVWNDFLQKTKPIEKVSKLPSFKVNLAINRSVILTTTFIVLIGSFTLVIAKFVDFSSTKSNTEIVREVKPDPNYKLATAIPIKKEVSKPTSTIAVVTNTLATSIPSIAIPTSTTNYIANQTNTYSSNSQSNSSSAGQNNSMMARNNPDTAVSNPDKKDTTLTQTPNNNQSRLRKKKKKEAEVLETKPLTTELPTTSTEEPELELK